MTRRLAWSLAGWAICVCAEVGAAPPSAGTSPAAPSTTVVSKANNEVAARLAKVFGCAEKLWPRWPVDTLSVLLIDVPAENAILLRGAHLASGARGDKPNVTPMPYERIAAQLKQRGQLGYAFLQMPSVGKVVAIFHSAASDHDLDRIVEMAMHEGFHYTGQAGFGRWSKSRGAYYPEDTTARYLRHEIMRSLKRAAEGGPLGPVAHWAGEFRARQGGRDPRAVDRIEGTAEYVGIVGLSIGSNGCSADELTLHSAALKYADRKLGARFTSLLRPDEDGEATVIGLYAGLVLRKSGRTGWQESVEKGATLLEVLLENVTPVSMPRDRDLFARLEAVITSQNDAYKPRIDALTKSLQSPLYVVVAFPAVRMGSVWVPPPPKGGTLTYEAGNETVRVSLGGHVSPLLGAQGGSLVLKGVDTRDASRTPCGPEPQIIFPVKRDGVTQLNSDRANMADEGVIGTNVRVLRRDRDGIPWFCVRPD
jgi:hypothetical protein